MRLDGDRASPDAASTWDQIERLISCVDSNALGREMMALMRRLFPICRSITGAGVRETLSILGERADLHVHEVPTGYRAFDWTVPREWNIRDAYVANEQGARVIDFQESNLHVISYSVPVSRKMALDELRPHLHTKQELPDAIPYLTSYYEERWGFCLSQNHLATLTPGAYDVAIDSSLEDGVLNYADAVIPGASDREVLFSTYVCHPSMANNELSGPVLVAFLQSLLARCTLKHTYRFVYAPETIGALVYLSRNGEHLREHLQAGYVVTCVGDDGPYTYKRSRRGDSLADRVGAHVARHSDRDRSPIILDYVPTGSDERRYCSPGFNLPVGSLTRTMHGTYPEYHTSLDNLEFVSAGGMASSLIAYLRIIQAIEMNETYVNQSPHGEPQLGRRGLWPTLGARATVEASRNRLVHLLSFSDGAADILDIAERANVPVWELGPELAKLVDAGLLRPAQP